MNKNKKSVSKLLDNGLGKLYLPGEGLRGIVLHEVWRRFYEHIFKTSYQGDKVNYRVFSQKVTKIKLDQLSIISKSKDYELYYEDAKVLLNCLQKELLFIAKAQGKLNYQIIVPEDIEKKLFGGITFFESEATSKIGGIKIAARVDCLIELDSDSFIVRDFKSYELEKENEPNNPESKYHRDFMQVCLYTLIYEKERYQKCISIQISYFPNQIISYEFTEELKKASIKFAMDTAFEGFDGICFEFPEEGADAIVEESEITEKQATGEPSMPPDPPEVSFDFEDAFKDKDCIGWINTLKGKPLEIIRGKDNRLKGYLFSSKAKQVRAYSLLKIETDSGISIGCKVEKIECFEDRVSGETASHKEENYKITLNPEVEFTPEGIGEVRPQTIIHGRIKKLTQWEFFHYKKIPQTGVPFGKIEGMIDDISYPLSINLLYQSLFMGGIQGTGKTTALKYLMLTLGGEKKRPSKIVFDAEEEYINLMKIATSKKNVETLKNYGVKRINPENFKVIKFGGENNNCLTFKAIDPLDLPLFLHELTSITYNTLQRIIKDIKIDKGRDTFTFPELKQFILEYVDKCGINHATRGAIERALMPVALDLFDRPGGNPIEVTPMLKSGRITILDCFELRDEEQRILALYILSALHKHKMKKRNIDYETGVLFMLDEVQRLLPKMTSNTESQKRLIHHIGEILHRGRKRKYGVIFATQSPLDIKKDIIDLCSIKIFFQIQEDTSSQLKEYLNKEEREILKRLPIGQAFIISKGKHEPVLIKFPNIN